MATGGTFHAVDPRTGEALAAYESAGPQDVRDAAVAAAAAFASGALGDPDARVALLRGAATRLRAAGDELVRVCGAETGLPEARLRGELERTAGQLEAFAAVVAAGDHVEAVIDLPDPDAKPIPRPDVRRMLIALGPVAVFGASNFPLAFSVAGGDTASALAAGCPVVVKGHPAHPGTSAVVARELGRAVAGAGLPEGAFTLLQAGSIEVGEALVDAPEIAAVGFTGSYRAGRALHDRAAARPQPIPVFAEMGSVNPLVVTAGALAARAGAIAEGLTASVATFGGQLCTKPGVVFLPAGTDGEAFAADVGARLAAMEPSVLLGESIRDGLVAGVERLADDGAEPVGERASERDEPPGFRFSPAAFRVTAADVTREPDLLEERFGPVVLFVSFADDAELLATLDSLGGQLTASIHAGPDEGDRVRRLAAALEPRVGRLVFDGFPTGVAVTHGMHHGGPFPATTSSHTSVGMTAIRRFQRPVAYQDAPAAVLPPELQDGNPRGIWRRVNSELTRD